MVAGKSVSRGATLVAYEIPDAPERGVTVVTRRADASDVRLRADVRRCLLERCADGYSLVQTPAGPGVVTNTRGDQWDAVVPVGHGSVYVVALGVPDAEGVMADLRAITTDAAAGTHPPAPAR
jgi:hypothetical protein